MKYGIYNGNNELKYSFDAPSYESACGIYSDYIMRCYAYDYFTCDINPSGYYFKELEY